MQDISLHLLDIIENSVRAEASIISIDIEINKIANKLVIIVTDNGKGMDNELLENAQNPFYTSKLERKIKVGLGIPLFKQNAELCEGHFKLDSKINEGTTLTAVFKLSHLDRMPLGSIADTILTSIIGHPEIEYQLKYKLIDFSDETEFIFDTRDIKEQLDGVPINYPEVVSFVSDYLTNEIKKIYMEEV